MLNVLAALANRVVRQLLRHRLQSPAESALHLLHTASQLVTLGK